LQQRLVGVDAARDIDRQNQFQVDRFGRRGLLGEGECQPQEKDDDGCD